jgi:hypothetical protein
VDSEINRMITSYDIRQNQCPRIAVACGEYKRPAILAALKGGWINGLVTDEHTARWLLTRNVTARQRLSGCSSTAAGFQSAAGWPRRRQ